MENNGAYTTRISELESDLEVEKVSKLKLEKQKIELQRNLDELTYQLEEEGRATQSQIDLNRKKETEIHRIKKEMDDYHIQNEIKVSLLKRKQQEALHDMAEQMEIFKKSKQKVEKEKQLLASELEDVKEQNENYLRNKNFTDKTIKELESQISDNVQKINRDHINIVDSDIHISKITSELNNEIKKLEESHVLIEQINNVKNNLTKNNEELLLKFEEETATRNKILSEFKKCQQDLANFKSMYKDEFERRSSFQKALSKSQSEMNELKRPHEQQAAIQRMEDQNDYKRKMNQKLTESEAQLEIYKAKCSGLEVIKTKLQNEIEDMSVEVARVQSHSLQAEKRQRIFDKAVFEWQKRSEDLQAEIEKKESECRLASATLYKTKIQVEDYANSMENMKKENNYLQETIDEMNILLNENEKKIFISEKTRKHLMIEIDDLHSSISEYDINLSREQTKYQRSQQDLLDAKLSIDQKIKEKEEEFEINRRNHLKALQSMQASLEVESRGRSEAIKAKKKLEAIINEMETSLDMSNKITHDAEKTIQSLQENIDDLKNEQRKIITSNEDIKESINCSLKKIIILTAELEEKDSRIEEFEKNKRGYDGELLESESKVGDLKTENCNLIMTKKKLEYSIYELRAEIENHDMEMKEQQDLYHRANNVINRLTEELKKAKEIVHNLDREQNKLEKELKERNLTYENSQHFYNKNDTLPRMEMRIKALEMDLEKEHKHRQDTERNLRKQKKSLKVYVLQSEEDKKVQLKLMEEIETMNKRLKIYKQQLEESEGIASVNLSKYRKVQHELEETENRAENAELNVNRLRSRARLSQSVSNDTCAVNKYTHDVNIYSSTHHSVGRGQSLASREHISMFRD